MTAARRPGAWKWNVKVEGRRYVYGSVLRPRRVRRYAGPRPCGARHREGSRGAPGDLAVDLGVGGVLAEPDGLAAAVIVAGPGRQQPQIAGEPAQPGPGRLVVVHVVDLDAVEPRGGEPRHRRLGHHLAALDGGRVREDGDAMRRP